ncbi:MAG: indolepyruvate ferredoxin oxidoreductase subunit alpha [Candidatus Methanomethyliaceae archaeon]|nr:indolepyruvate ferredoxin oxidoreductase subunit alpha [Candidatus Methanomethyliaceae archaeon]MDW7971396.1 indolepyruvate ferredoxin oxidoreductase subunit alpha [Nitrososphaerota archaeon]
MKHIIEKNSPGERVLLLGNEAIARGALESNIEIAASYPGTPASEIIDTLALVANNFGIHVEWSTNEKVAFEVAIGGAMCGKRSMASMKHIGANWIMDPLMHSVYHGFNAALLIISADDPSGHSSANEQDNRYMANMAEIPVLEPSNVQEAKDFVKAGVEISERIRLPVMIRMVTRICHSKGVVTLSELNRNFNPPKFYDDYHKEFVLNDNIVGPRAVPRMHEVLHKKLERVEDIAEELSLFKEENSEGHYEDFGVISSSVAVSYVLDFIKRRGLIGKIKLLKLGLTYPFPRKNVSKFISNLNRVLIVEEGEPFIERNLAALAKEENPRLEILGKLTNHIPREGELNFSAVDNALSRILGLEPEVLPKEKLMFMERASKILTPRTLTMCAGCPHRAAYYVAKKALRSLQKPEYIAIGDIGCYTLGMNLPLRFMQNVFGMGGSIGVANGAFHSGIGVPIIATIGDSTFYHAGIPALINATFNRANIKVMVLDNFVTGMTGYQPHPGTGQTATGQETKKVHIEEICKACGIDLVKIVDPYDYKSSLEAMKEVINFPGPAVIIFRRLCAQVRIRMARMAGERILTYSVDAEKCNGCRTCIIAFGCPAIGFDLKNRKAFIDPNICIGCGVCINVCPNSAIVR